MKELTIEQKAKAYDEAVENMRKFRDALNNHEELDLWVLKKEIVKDIEYYFPELKVSDSEKIRNFISNELACLRATDEKGTVRYNELTEAIAWLEAHEEQVNLPHFTFDDVLALQCAMGAAKKVQKDEDLYKQLESLHDRVHDAYWIEKQGEQKPSWSEEDIELIDNTIKFIEDRVAATSPSLRTYSPTLTGKEIPFLKALKDRVQPKQEWSEEDNRMCKAIIDNIQAICGEGYFVGNIDSGELIEWLKSLRPQSQWKPSDEQMDALRYVTNFDYGGYKATLVSLYEQLKKLRGE